jgi:regulatory protein
MENKELSINQIQSKLEYYCSYQDRCYKEIEQKLKQFVLIPAAKEKIISHLIEHKFIDEERFAKSFARGKHNYKLWGKNRIIQELKFRDITQKTINLALQEIKPEVYLENFNQLAEKYWNNNTDRKGQKKNKKLVDFLLRKGYETNLVYDKLKELDL